MRIRVIAVGTRLPQWAQGAVDEYAKRMPPECRVEERAPPAGAAPAAECEANVQYSAQRAGDV